MNRPFVLLASCIAAASIGCSSSSPSPRSDSGTPVTPGPNLAVSLISPLDGQTTNGASVVLSAEVDGGIPDTVSFWVDGAQVLSASSAPYLSVWDAGALAEGNHQIFAKAVLDGGSFVSATHQFVIDRTPPRVVSVLPAPSVPTVCVSEPFTVQFSEPIARWPDSGVVCPSCPQGLHLPLALFFDDGGVMASNSDLTDDGGTAWVQGGMAGWGTGATGNLGQLTLEVPSPGLSDLAGNALPSFQQSWRIDPYCILRDHGGAWSIPQLDHPALAMDANLDVFVAGHRYDGGALSVVVYRYSQATGWAQLGGPLNSVAGQSVDWIGNYQGDVLTPGLAVDSQGNPWVAFYESDGALVNGYVWKWDGTSWSQVGGAINPHSAQGQSIRVYDPTSGSTPGYRHVPFGLDGNDAPYLAVTQPPDVGQVDQMFLMSFVSGSWTSLANLTTNASRDVIWPVLAVGNGHQIYVAYIQLWSTRPGNYYTTFAARWDPSISFWRPIGDTLNYPANWTGQEIDSPLALAVSDNGNLYLAFAMYDSTASRKNMYVAEVGSDGKWTEIGELNASTGTEWPYDTAAIGTFTYAGIDQVQLTFLENVGGQGLLGYQWDWNEMFATWTMVPSPLLPLGSGALAEEPPAEIVHALGAPVTALVQPLDAGVAGVFVQRKYSDVW